MFTFPNLISAWIHLAFIQVFQIRRHCDYRQIYRHADKGFLVLRTKNCQEEATLTYYSNMYMIWNRLQNGNNAQFGLIQFETSLIFGALRTLRNLNLKSFFNYVTIVTSFCIENNSISGLKKKIFLLIHFNSFIFTSFTFFTYIKI